MTIFIVWIVFIYLEQKTSFNAKKVCEEKEFLDVVIPSEDTKILEFNQCWKSDNTPSILYSDLEYLIKKKMNAKIILKNHLQQK